LRKALRKSQPFGRARQAVLQAPIRGWRSDEGAAKDQPGAAIRLKNWVPEADAVRIRRGYSSHATGMTNDVETLMVYTSGSATTMFAAAGSVIYDVSSAGAGSSSLTTLTSARWSWTNMATSGGKFLVIANGADTVRQWSGSAWTAPSITGPSATTDLIFVWQHKQRLWFIQKNSTKAWYLPVDSIAGAATEFEIGSLFRLGGRLLAGATWSVDAGDGMDDLNVFVTSEGQVAIYSMSDPSDPTTLSMKGVYFVGKPIGDRCLHQIGGELVVITRAGVVPLSKVITVDATRLDIASLTAPIRVDYANAARLYAANNGWQIVSYPKNNLLILNIPVIEDTTSKQYVMNLLTGAWAEWDSINALSWVVYNENLYFGDTSGVVYKADTGSADAGAPITADMVLTFSQMGARARQKHILLVRPNVDANVSSRGSVYPITDYKTSNLTDINSGAVNNDVALWDVALWDDAVWPGSDIISEWRGDGNIGTAISLQYIVQASTSAITQDLDFWLISFDVTYEVGGVL
jgi:hypothetical protein